MRCPKCGGENPDDAQLCRSCSCVLKRADTPQSKTQIKGSKSVVFAVTLAGLSVILAISVRPTLAFLAAAFGFLISIWSIAETIRGKKKLTAKRIAIALFILLQMILLTYWRIDTAPIPKDYTINDIRSAAPEYNHTYRLLQSLADKNDDLMDAAAIGLSREDLKNLEEINNIFKEDDFQTVSQQLQANAQSILSIWQNAKKGKDILAKLDTFPEIADLTEPFIKHEFSWVKNFRRLILLYRSYICLQSCTGNQEAAVGELIRLHSILKKISLNARSLILELVCIACFAVDIEMTNFIITNPETSDETLLVLREHVLALSDEHTTLRNGLIFEYLTFKNELMKITKEPRLRYSFFAPLKLNSTLRLFRNFCDKWIGVAEHRTQIEEFQVWPALYPNLPARIESQGKLPWYYRTYNPLGSFFAVLLTPAIERVITIRTKLQIHSDLLQIVLDKRLGREVNLKARAYSDEYIVDVENKKVFSPGPAKLKKAYVELRRAFNTYKIIKFV